MKEWELNAIISSSFTHAEKTFLYSNSEFKDALARASKKNIDELLQLGVRLVLTRGYEPPVSLRG